MGDDARTARFLQRCLSLLPARAVTEDSNRLAAAFFALAALDRLAVTPRPRILQPGSEENLAAVEWILSLQCGTGGFRGGTSAGEDGIEGAHLVLSLFAVLSLGVLRAPRTCFDRVDVDGLLRFVGRCQRDDGSFVPVDGSDERDPRSTLGAIGLCSLLVAGHDPFHPIRLDPALAYIASCRSYDGGYGFGPGQESHAGATFCVLACLHLAGRSLAAAEADDTLAWLHRLQVEMAVEDEDAGTVERLVGVSGRINKPADACYCFWTGASLRLLAPDLPPLHNLEPYLLACRDDRIGGFGKTPDDEADLYHTHFALSALALAREGGGFDAALDVSTAAVKWVREMVASN